MFLYIEHTLAFKLGFFETDEMELHLLQYMVILMSGVRLPCNGVPFKHCSVVN